MALANFTVADVAAATPVFPTSSAPLRIPLDDLLYSPEDHQHESAQSQHEPYAPPSNHNQKRSKLRKRAGTSYLPPQNQYTHYPRQDVPHNPYTDQLHTQIYQQNSRLDISIENQRVNQFDNNGQYVHDPSGDYDYEQRRLEESRRAGYRPGFQEPPYPPATAPTPQSSRRYDPNYPGFNSQTTSQPQRPVNDVPKKASSVQPGQKPPDQPPGFVKVDTGSSGGKTQLHAILDYDDEDEYYDDGSEHNQPAVTPLQGPIFVKNGSVPVVPLTSYNTVNNGSFYQIPILWTALSVALGYELQGQVIKGVPCIKRNYQLYCPTAGNTYPLDKIELFIDENKALIKRMYGSFATPGGGRVRRAPGVPDLNGGDSYFRHVRQAAGSSNLPDPQSVNSTGRVDSCESKTEIMTPYWALNSARKLRAIVNTMHFEQAIHQEVCSKKSTSRCSGDCGCEQKYKWHRLLAYDPSDDCAGIFMDWFLFPSCCVCRCNP